MHRDQIKVMQSGEHLASPNGFGAVQNFQGDIAVEPVARVIDITKGAVAELLGDLKLSPSLTRLERFGQGSRNFQGYCLVRNFPASAKRGDNLDQGSLGHRGG